MSCFHWKKINLNVPGADLGFLQGRVSNPSQRGTGGRAPKAPKAWGPLPRKFVYYLYKNGEFLCIPSDICEQQSPFSYKKYAIFLFRKGAVIKRAGVRTTPPPLDPPLCTAQTQKYQCFSLIFCRVAR